MWFSAVAPAFWVLTSGGCYRAFVTKCDNGKDTDIDADKAIYPGSLTQGLCYKSYKVYSEHIC